MTEILQIYISSFWAWAGISVGIGSILDFILKMWNRWLRHRNIMARGWPTAHLMDADGDIVHPKPRAD